MINRQWLKDKSDPNGRDIRATENGASLDLTNRKYIQIKNLEIRNGSNAVLLIGSSCEGNVIENSRILHGRYRVLIKDGAKHNHIRNNEITMNLFGRRPGAWQGGSADGEILYRFFKYISGFSSSADSNVELLGAR